MSRLAFAAALFFSLCLPAVADTFQFTVTGDGFTSQFAVPNPPAVTEHPHNISVGTSGTGSVNNTAGYNFSVSVVAVAVSNSFPNFVLTVDPLPPGLTPGQIYGQSFQLYGPDLVTLVAETPNPVPCGASCPNDLLSFAFVPGNYAFYGFDPDGAVGNYSVSVAQLSSSTVTPEPGSWMLTLTGILALGCLPGCGLRGRVRARSVAQSATRSAA